ncbi:hypothetical protein J2Z83_000082 [Virgibacillus natechei]|uniref:Uncharacterized protein n=1 Tax=Virgibacillus natechei TaxID=1216297 RepID=A0ABS4IAN1_9BACI|nr:hypothetical protein [Virgibacillus natechei]
MSKIDKLVVWHVSLIIGLLMIIGMISIVNTIFGISVSYTVAAIVYVVVKIIDSVVSSLRERSQSVKVVSDE